MEVTEKGYVKLATYCRKLQVLRMYACAGVNDAVFKACGQYLPHLTNVDACGAHLLTDAGVQVTHKHVLFAHCSMPHIVVLYWPGIVCNESIDSACHS